MFEPVSPVRAYERVVEQIEEAVFTGRLRPGSRLPSERDLMTQFGVSRSTVREALRVLQSNGMIQSRAGDPRGPEVLPASPKSLQKSMSRLVRAESMSLAELLQFRMLLEGSAYLLAARLRTDAQLAEMEAALQSMAKASGHAEFSDADVAFHDAVARATQNTLILVCSNVVRGVVLDLIADHLATATDRQALMQAYLQHHSEVLQAIHDRDGELAARLARQALYDYYADSVPLEDRALLEPLIASP
ncbi:FadR/GntR family transcriptional regulator [Kibdelosporangium aridum]|uniref:DNA-binding transcriptional regulator, FadR family n=1 Tax=Kibdelosporangium aridum TaxID=2030 RepID=A0A1Y5XR92_KIBAR|nr:FadR/GntR family transcriptional regulator [Kibdelosporangium aridum]SMD13592.1 DNA-binding transcriptional regulator, FadR family [Kibdelosporangium aridum]